MRITTKISTRKGKTVISRKLEMPSSGKDEKGIMLTSHEVSARKSILLNIEKIVMYVLILLLAVHLIRQDALQAFTGTASAYSLIDDMQTVVLILCSFVALYYTLSTKVGSFQSIFNVLFGISAYLLLLEQGIFFSEEYDYVICILAIIGIMFFTVLQGYKYRTTMPADFQMYFKTQSCVYAFFALLASLVLPYLFNDDAFVQVQINDVCISLGDKITLYLQLLGNVLLMFAIAELVIKVRKLTIIDDIFN